MPLGSTPDMLVVTDGHSSCAAGLAVARRYARGHLTLAGWDADTSGDEGTVQASAAAQPTVAEALRVAAQNRISWITMRRDLAPPEQLLADLLVGAAHQRDTEIPGYAVLLADGEPGPFRRILAIVDRRGGPMSGLLAYVGVALAGTAGADLDILVIGDEHEDLGSLDRESLLAINREQELYERARARAREVGLNASIIPVSGAADPWLVIADQLSYHDYDLVIDDLGAISLSRGRIAQGVEGALGEGQVGEIPLRLLTEVPTPLLLVIDEIRLGILPASLLKAGAVAAISLGVASAAVLPVASSAAATQAVRREGSGDLIDHLQEALDSVAEDEARSSEASTSSRGTAAGARAVAETAATTSFATAPVQELASASPSATDASAKASQEPPKAEPKAPKGGATPSQVAKARRAAAASKAELKSAEKARDKSAATVEKTEGALGDAAVKVEQAVIALADAQAEVDATAAAAEDVASRASGVLAVLPGGPTDQDAQAASDDAGRAQEQYEQAAYDSGEALNELLSAQLALEDEQFRLGLASTEAAEAKVGYSYDKAKFEVYRESLAATRQSPVGGGYRLTARFGQSGGLWSSGVHTGLDFAGKQGTDITAAASGTVVSAGYEGAYGNRVVVDHGNGYRTTYNHLSSIKASVGDKLSTGDLVGAMGGTGNVTGVHLHFEVTHNDKFVDPEGWLGW